MKPLSKAPELRDKRVLIRVDYNVPIEEGRVSDNSRLKATIPLLKQLISQGNKLILMSHLGRPKGSVKEELSLAPVAKELSALLRQQVSFLSDCIGAEVERAVMALKPGEVALLENTRFHPEEKQNDSGFAQQLARLGEVFVFEGFAVAHRKNASTTGVQQYLPSYYGPHVEKELNGIRNILDNIEQPLIVVLGGAKLSDKMAVIKYLGPKTEMFLVGGAMAFPLLAAQGIQVGASYCEEGSIELAKQLDINMDKVLLPQDFMAAQSRDSTIAELVSYDSIPEGKAGLDIGPATTELFRNVLVDANTIIWNGPMGVFENPAFSEGTSRIARAIAGSGAVTLVGGGDTLAALNQLAPSLEFTHVSTGGGALLTLLSGKNLPALS